MTGGAAPQVAVQPAGNAPTLPPGPPAPGVAQVAAAQQQNTNDLARALERLSQNPKALADPQAAIAAERMIRLQYGSRETLLAGQMKAITEARSLSIDAHTKSIMAIEQGAPITPQVYQSIIDDPNLDGASREHLSTMYNTAIKGTVEGFTKEYGSNFYQVYDRLSLPNGDPNKISDPSQVLPLINGSLTPAGVSKIVQEMDVLKKRDPTLVERKKELMQEIMPTHDPLGGPEDAAARQRRYRMSWDIDQQIAQYQDQKKNPNDLFDPSNPAFIGKPYEDQIAAQQLAQKLQGDKGLATQAGVVAAYQAGKITRDQAAERFKALGVPFTVTPPIPAVSVPLAR